MKFVRDESFRESDIRFRRTSEDSLSSGGLGGRTKLRSEDKIFGRPLKQFFNSVLIYLLNFFCSKSEWILLTLTPNTEPHMRHLNIKILANVTKVTHVTQVKDVSQLVDAP
jgi:hypothetical protein